MTTLLMLLRGASLVLWLTILFRFAPAMVRAFRLQHRRSLDPIWAVAWGLAFNRVYFVARDTAWHPSPPSDVESAVLVVGYLMACALAFALIKLRGWYGD